MNLRCNKNEEKMKKFSINKRYRDGETLSQKKISKFYIMSLK